MACARIVFLAISMVLLSSVAMAVDHVVGDDRGWTTDFNYAEWAQDKVFQVGDNLVFNYDNTKHNVVKLNGTLFNSCTFPAGTEALTSGNDVVQLTSSGRKWYACGKADHCAARGMKLAITVLANGPNSAPGSPPPSSHALSSSASGPLMAAMLAVAALVFA
ncbi:basic blue protein-like [Neltuma alba]|uniref:basic blue protein-like n=1 Tax=Neltuma alba TaxID=207710 RepID=UPI0010A59E0A|nr:basic blue protein-like [Prosopis alba]XP_028761284.1 basic blue protein-like [Prosopis alba]